MPETTKAVTKTVEALGHTWTFSPNDMAAEFEREALRQRAEKYVYSLRKPSAYSAAHTILLSYRHYKDIMSAVVSIDEAEGDEETNQAGSNLLFELLLNPAKWVELVMPVWFTEQGDEIVTLWKAACEVNPDWYPAEVAGEETGAKTGETPSEEVEAAHQQLAEIEAALADPEADHPETEGALEAAGIIMQHAEQTAKKKAGSARKRA